MTIHSAKGLEFETVFISGLEQDLFPHKRMDEDSVTAEESEEEREEERGGAIHDGTITGPPFIASKRGAKFHLRTCPFISKINPENRIEIMDKSAARKRELKPCECVQHAESEL